MHRRITPRHGWLLLHQPRVGSLRPLTPLLHRGVSSLARAVACRPLLPCRPRVRDVWKRADALDPASQYNMASWVPQVGVHECTCTSAAVLGWWLGQRMITHKCTGTSAAVLAR